MKAFLSQFYKLSAPLRIAVGVALLAALALGTWNLAIRPEKKKYDTLALTLSNLKESNEAKSSRIQSIRTKSATLEMTDDQTAAMTQAGNTVVSSAELPDIIEEIKDIARKSGAAEVAATEGAPRKKLIQIEGGAGMFTVYALPLELSFTSNYRKISELLFTLHGKRLFLGVPNIEMESNDYTSSIDAKITIELYYREEL